VHQDRGKSRLRSISGTTTLPNYLHILSSDFSRSQICAGLTPAFVKAWSAELRGPTLLHNALVVARWTLATKGRGTTAPRPLLTQLAHSTYVHVSVPAVREVSVASWVRAP